MLVNRRVSKLDRNRQRGYVLVEALLVTVGIGFLAVASISLQDTLTRNQAKVSIHSQLSEMRRMVMENLNNPGVWDQIVQNPENGIKQCLADSTETCDYRPPKAIGLEISSANKLIIDPKKAEIGFGMNLEGCSTYASEKHPATDCPFQAKMLWQPICSVGGDCKQVEVSVELNADRRFEELYSFSSESYSFKLKKNVALKRSEMVPGSRTLTFQADSSAPKAVKVFFILDNSESMSDDRENLARGLESFVDGMNGYDVQYYVYTTESLLWANWWTYPETDPSKMSKSNALERAGGVFTMPDGSSVESDFSWSKIPNQKFKRWDGRMVMAPDMAKRNGIDLHQPAENPNLAKIKTSIRDLMKDLEDPPPGAGDEAGLCTLSHLLFDDGPNNPLQPGDSAIFMVLSDEDESGYQFNGSSATICPGKIGVRPNDVTEVYRQWCDLWTNADNCQSATFSMRAPYKYWKTAYFQWRLKDSYWDDYRDLCESTKSNGCGTVGTKTSCTRKDIPGADPYPWTWNNKCHTEVTRTDEEVNWYVEAKDIDNGAFIQGKNYCTQSFKHKGKTYSNIRDFAKRYGGAKDSDFDSSGQCWFNGHTHQPAHQSQWAVKNSKFDSINNMGDKEKFRTPMNDLYNSIPGRLREQFGSDGYGLFMVVHDAERDKSAGCIMDASAASYGAKYKQVLLASDTPGNLISVCSKSYAASIEHMRTQAQQIARDTYVLDPFDPLTERVYSVQVQRNGAPLILAKSDYGISGANVQFKAGFIQGNDQITVVIVPK